MRKSMALGVAMCDSCGSIQPYELATGVPPICSGCGAVAVVEKSETQVYKNQEEETKTE